MLKQEKRSFILIALFLFGLFLCPSLFVRAIDQEASFSEPSKILIDSTTNRVFVLNFKSNEITVFDGAEKGVIGNISSGGEGLVYGEIFEDKNGERSLYVVNEGSKSIVRFPGLASKDDLNSDLIKQISENKEIIKTEFPPSYIFSDKELQKLYVVGPKNFLIIDRNTEKTTILNLGDKSGGKALCDPDNHRIWFFNRGEGVLFVIDGEKNEILKTISVMGGNTFGAFMGHKDKIFISSREGDVYVVGENGVINTIKTGSRLPVRMGINHATEKIYLPNQADFTATVINLKDYKIIKKIQLPSGTIPGELAIDEVSNLIFIPNTVDNSVSIIDGNKDEVITTLKVGVSPLGVTINSKTGEAYIPNKESNSISIVSKSSDGSYQEQTIPDNKEKISTGERLSYPYRLIFNESKNELYVLNNTSGRLLIVDGKNYKIKENIFIGQNPLYFIFAPELNKLFISVKNEDKIVSYDILNKSIKNIPVGHYPAYLFFNPQTKKLYVDNYGSRNLSVIDAEKDSFLHNVSTDGALITSFIFNPKENKIYTVSLENNEVIVINGEDGEIINRIKFETRISNIFFDELSSNLFVTKRTSNEITVIDGKTDQIIKQINQPPLTSNVGRVESDFIGGSEIGGRVFLAADEKVITIDSASLNVGSSFFSVNGFPIKIIANKDRQELYVLTNRGSFYVFNTKENLGDSTFSYLGVFSDLSRNFPEYFDQYERGVFGGFGKGVISSSNNKMFIAIPGADIVSIVNLKNNKLEAVITNDGLKTAPGNQSIVRYLLYAVGALIVFGFGGLLFSRRKYKH